MSGEGRGWWRPVLVCGLVLAGGLVSGCSGAARSGVPAAERSSGQLSQWVDGATVESVAKTLGVRLPETATEAKAAHLQGVQDDGLILAFVLPTADVDAFVDALKPERPLGLRQQPLAHSTNPTTPFSHLGLPEPDLLAPVREGQVCAPCAEDLNWLRVAVAPVDDRTSRVYLRGVD
ncbi:hypothetical protein NRK68_19555 [Streptomyces yangpuensis]|uniref:Tudor domain-containing protein n=1 Tax=Streptomyces yangpuensis TaxID=1648182 RepID=A0ABY5PYI6_9ACTN|nr:MULTISPECIES: hypothetical protein [Streptomyces]MBZ9597399.1 hypothetical protein [Streptomyces erythrochromogenes]UUY49207.1 hypothetical protein NRK68_19555 [Streptomyces yangpuensis]